VAPTPDPFAHHPELRDRIEDPAAATFFRTLNVETLFADKPELHWALELLYGDATREEMRRAALADHAGGDLWIFAYGSLMWNPALHFTDVRRARVTGFARRFILEDIYGGRGTREQPGLMAALDTGEACDGLVFRIAAADIETETEILWRRECFGPGYLPTFVTADLGDGTVRALTFLADHGTDAIRADLSFEDQVAMIATGTGFLGSSRDYLANLVAHFAALGIDDADCTTLLDAVDRHPGGAGVADGAPSEGVDG